MRIRANITLTDEDNKVYKLVGDQVLIYTEGLDGNTPENIEDIVSFIRSLERALVLKLGMNLELYEHMRRR